MAVHTGKYRWLEVGTARWTEAADLSTINWVSLGADSGYAALPVDVTKRLGANPSTMTVLVRGNPANRANGDRVFGASVQRPVSDYLPDGSLGSLSSPPGPEVGKPFDFSRPCRLREADSNSPGDIGNATTKFMGMVTDYTYNLKSEQWSVIVSEIARWHLNKIALYGSHVWQPETGGAVWLEDSLPTYNPRGMPNQQFDDSAGEVALRFINPNYNSENEVQQDTDKDYAVSWTYRYIMNSLREEYNQGGEGMISTAEYLSWPESTGTVWEFLQTDPTSDKPQRAKNFTLGGLSLRDAIDSCVGRAGPYTWRCEWNETTSKYDLDVFSELDGDGTSDLELERGKPGTSTGSIDHDVIGGNLNFSWEDACSRVVAFGAPKRYEISVDTGGGSTLGGLVRGWDSSINAPYRASAQKESREYQDLFQKYTFAKDIDWYDWFNDNWWYDGPREPLPFMLSRVFGISADGGETSQRLDLLAWRYKDAAWEPAPEGVGVSVHPDGIMLSGRKKGEDLRWGDDGATGYEIRITLAVEADNRLITDTSPTAATRYNWPTMEKVVDSQDNLWEARVLAYIPQDAGGSPVRNNPNSTATMGTRAAPDVIRNDADHLFAEAQRTLDVLSHPDINGSLSLPLTTSAAWETYIPGRRVGKLVVAQTDIYRQDIDLNAIIKEVDFVGLNTDAPRVLLSFGG